ncbi:MAG: hypothetical protein GY804_09180 [Alphaproteobacteria bacterium]|nr:hypothetical protein [Alphaproteobacteria bacterium]
MIFTENEFKAAALKIIDNNKLSISDKMKKFERIINTHGSENGYKNSMVRLVEEYVEKNTWTVKENANMGYCHNAQVLHSAGVPIKEYVLYNLDQIDPKISQAHNSGDIHLHDLKLGTCCYCYGGDIRHILLHGFASGTRNANKSAPPKRFEVALSQICNAIFCITGEVAGAVSFNDLDIYLAYYVKMDNLSYEEVRQAMESFIFNLNIQSRLGGQTPFSNIGMSLKVDPIKNKPIIYNGEELTGRYGDIEDYQQYIDMINLAFVDVMLKGSYDGKPFSFPIPTYNVISKDVFDNRVGDEIMKMTSKMGTPYFANYITTDLDPEEIRSMCPMHEDTVVVVKHDSVRPRETTLKKLAAVYKTHDTCKVSCKGKWFNAKLVSIKPESAFAFYTEFGTKVIFEGRHKQPYRIDDGPMQIATAAEIYDIYLSGTGHSIFFPSEYNDYDETLEKYNGFYWHKLSKAYKKEVKEDVKYYCFAVDSDEHLFKLANGIVTHNCRVNLRLSDLKKQMGNAYLANANTGSIAVVTMNLSRFGYIAKTEEEFFNLLDENLDLAAKSLDWKRQHITRMFEKGLFPYIKSYLGDSGFRMFFSTIGVIGGHEACINFLGKGIETKEGFEFSMRILNHILKRCQEYTDKYNAVFNLEATPAEGTCYTLALKDKKLFGDSIYMSGTPECPYYTNSTMLPVGLCQDPIEVLKHQTPLQDTYTSGTVLHLYLSDKVPSPIPVKKFIQNVFGNYKIPYMSISPTFVICPKHGYSFGEHCQDDTCNEDVVIYSRVTGFYRPIDSFNPGKQREYIERTSFKI